MRRAVLTLLALVLVALTAASASPAQAVGGVFDDVRASTPFARDIEWLAAEGITSGSAARFRPDGPVTRQAMAVFLYKFAHDGDTPPGCTSAAYRDVPRSSPYCGSIRWLGRAGITSGTANGGFAPLEPVTRQAMAAFLYKLDSGGRSPQPCTVAPYADVPASSPYCGSIDWLWNEGVTTGELHGGFAPRSPVTRGMMAAFLHRFDTARTTPLGVDVSHPQCGRALPVDRAFAIVGVNKGKPRVLNPCLADQLVWAAGAKGGTSQPKAQLYVNTANPGLASTAWPTGGSNGYGTCAGTVTAACAYEYGRARAVEDLAAVTGPAGYMWWLDVEIDLTGRTGNTWETTSAGRLRNRAVVEGMADALQDAGVAGVGLYSTAAQWRAVVGDVTSGPLLGLPSWLAGATGLAPARRMCGLPPLTRGGSVELVQFVDEAGFDRNLACR